MSELLRLIDKRITDNINKNNHTMIGTIIDIDWKNSSCTIQYNDPIGIGIKQLPNVPIPSNGKNVMFKTIEVGMVADILCPLGNISQAIIVSVRYKEPIKEQNIKVPRMPVNTL